MSSYLRSAHLHDGRSNLTHCPHVAPCMSWHVTCLARTASSTGRTSFSSLAASSRLLQWATCWPPSARSFLIRTTVSLTLKHSPSPLLVFFMAPFSVICFLPDLPYSGTCTCAPTSPCLLVLVDVLQLTQFVQLCLAARILIGLISGTDTGCSLLAVNSFTAIPPFFSRVFP